MNVSWTIIISLFYFRMTDETPPIHKLITVSQSCRPNRVKWRTCESNRVTDRIMCPGIARCYNGISFTITSSNLVFNINMKTNKQEDMYVSVCPHYMTDETHASPFVVLNIFDSKEASVYCWAVRDLHSLPSASSASASNHSTSAPFYFKWKCINTPCCLAMWARLLIYIKNLFSWGL